MIAYTVHLNVGCQYRKLLKQASSDADYVGLVVQNPDPFLPTNQYSTVCTGSFCMGHCLVYSNHDLAKQPKIDA